MGVTTQGYIVRHLRGHPLAGKRGHVLEHRIVASQKLGRWLRPEEQVHHINGDKQDNRPENLEVYPDAASHTHAVAVGILKPCPGCGRERQHRAKGLCDQCYNRFKVQRRHNPDLEPKDVQPSKPPVTPKPCPSCGRVRLLWYHGMCNTCWRKIWEREIRKPELCLRCGRMKIKHARDMCGACYVTLRSRHRLCNSAHNPETCPWCPEASHAH